MASRSPGISSDHPLPEDLIAQITDYEKRADLLDAETTALEKEAASLFSDFSLEELEEDVTKLEAAADTLEMAAAMAAAAIETESEEGSDMEDILRPRRVMSPGKKPRTPRTRVAFQVPLLVTPPVVQQNTLALEEKEGKMGERIEERMEDTGRNGSKRKPSKSSRTESSDPIPGAFERRKRKREKRNWEEESRAVEQVPRHAVRLGRKWRQMRWERLRRAWRRREERWRKHQLELQHARRVKTSMEASGVEGAATTNTADLPYL